MGLFLRALGRGRLGLLLAAVFATTLATCKKECAKCTTDADCQSGSTQSTNLMCVSFADGSMRCGSGVGATICH